MRILLNKRTDLTWFVGRHPHLGLTSVAFPLSGDDFVAEYLHLSQNSIDLWHDVSAINLDRTIRSETSSRRRGGGRWRKLDEEGIILASQDE